MTDAPKRIWAFYTPHDFEDSATITAYEEVQRGGQEYTRADIADALKAEVAALRAENERLRECLKSTRVEICEGPLDDTLWHTAIPACTTVDNITLTLQDGWSYDEWLEARAVLKGGE